MCAPVFAFFLMPNSVCVGLMVAVSRVCGKVRFYVAVCLCFFPCVPVCIFMFVNANVCGWFCACVRACLCEVKAGYIYM